jgi:hypothetical protein
MSVWHDKTGRRPSGGHRSSVRTFMRPKFQKFRWRSFLFESRVRTVRHCRPNGRTPAASNFHIEALRVRTKRMGILTVNLMHAISISDARASGPCWLSSGLELRYLPYGWAHPDGNPRLPDGCSNLPISVFGKKSWSLIEHWGSSGRAAESSRRMQAGAVWSFST